MNIETVYNSMMKTAAFTNYGAGAAANDTLRQYDNRRAQLTSDLANQTAGKPGLIFPSPEEFQKAMKMIEYETMPSRHEVEDLYKGFVDKAKLPTALTAGGAGLGAAGLTYAGLGLFPALRKKRLARLLAGAAVGIPTGAIAGHYAGKNLFEQYRNNARSDVNNPTSSRVW